jgi:hypothetical protein
MRRAGREFNCGKLQTGKPCLWDRESVLLRFMRIDFHSMDEPRRAPVSVRAARAKLNAPPRVRSVWPVLGAAALAAGAALMLATAVIIGPPNLGPDLTVGGAEADGPAVQAAPTRTPKPVDDQSS